MHPWEEDLAKVFGTHWYRSKEQFTPFLQPFVGGGYLSNKKWPLNEECITMILQITQSQWGIKILMEI